MKKVVYAFVAASVLSLSAAPAFAKANNTIVVAQDEKVAVKIEELPEAVKAALKGDEHKEWVAESATLDKAKGVYEITLKKGAETKTVKFDKDGNKVA